MAAGNQWSKKTRRVFSFEFEYAQPAPPIPFNDFVRRLDGHWTKEKERIACVRFASIATVTGITHLLRMRRPGRCMSFNLDMRVGSCSICISHHRPIAAIDVGDMSFDRGRD